MQRIWDAHGLEPHRVKTFKLSNDPRFSEELNNHANVDAWLERRPRFHLHFTPNSSSWLNLVERWFRELTDKAIRRGVFHSVPDLIAAIDQLLAADNGDPQPFTWTASIDSILEKVGRCKAVLETVH